MADSAFRIDVLTLFPALFDGFLSESIMSRAIAKGLVDVRLWDLREWATGNHRQVDDRPFGGGPGMVLMAPPVVAAVEAIQPQGESPGRLIALTPGGKRLDQTLVRTLAAEPRLILLCGRYEGFDERIFEVLGPELVSVGDYVLSGGEVAAMVVIDAAMRLIPGVLGDAGSAEEESFGGEGGLEYPHYTRPRQFRGHDVPDVLLSGDHQAIHLWRAAQSRSRTADRRQDLVDPTLAPLPTLRRPAVTPKTPRSPSSPTHANSPHLDPPDPEESTGRAERTD